MHGISPYSSLYRGCAECAVLAPRGYSGLDSLFTPFSLWQLQIGYWSFFSLIRIILKKEKKRGGGSHFLSILPLSSLIYKQLYFELFLFPASFMRHHSKTAAYLVVLCDSQSDGSSALQSVKTGVKEERGGSCFWMGLAVLKLDQTAGKWIQLFGVGWETCNVSVIFGVSTFKCK